MSQKITSIIGHHIWLHGGETKVALDTLKVFCKIDIGDVYAAASAKPAKEHEERILRTCTKIFTFIPWSINYFSIAQRSLVWRAIRNILIKNAKDTLVWIDNGLYAPLIKYKSSNLLGLIEYIYFPYEIILYKNWDFLPNDLINEAKEYFVPLKTNKLRWNYIKLAIRLESRYRRANPFDSANIVLAASEWTSMIVRYLYHGFAIQHQPAVDINLYSSISKYEFDERADQIISIGRISPEKRHDEIIRAISVSETRPKLVIIGGLSKSKQTYLRSLERLATELGVDLRIYPNASQEKILDELKKSRVYVHATRGEHFGIAVIEAMAAGLPVIVHKSGGPYHDITKRGKYGMYFTNTNDLASKIDQLVSDIKKWKIFSYRSIERAQYYSYKRYYEQLTSIIRNLI